MMLTGLWPPLLHGRIELNPEEPADVSLAKLPVGNEGVQHAADVLADFTSLPIDLSDEAHSWALVPEAFVAQFARRPAGRRIKEGGIGAGSAPRNELIRVVESHLARHDDSVVLMPHTLARWGDPFLKSSSVRVSFIADRVYCFLDSGTRAHLYVEVAIQNFWEQFFILLLGRSRRSPYDPSRTLQWPQDVLSDVVQSWTSLYVGAFDAESLVVVERPEQTSGH
jgi:hypothetical protein